MLKADFIALLSLPFQGNSIREGENFRVIQAFTDSGNIQGLLMQGAKSIQNSKNPAGKSIYCGEQ